MIISKRQLGVATVAIGILAIGGLIAYDVLRHHPIGQRLQLVALGMAFAAIVIGLTLIPLKDRPV